MRRDDPRMQIIRRAIEGLTLGGTPAFLSLTITETFPLAPEKPGKTWTGTPEEAAETVFTALYGRPDTTAELSPLAQSDEAHASRDAAAVVDVLTRAEQQLTGAPWYPVRPGDLVHVHYEPGGRSPAFGETYVIGHVGAGLMSMQLLAHTLPESAGTPEENGVGCFAADAADDPLYTAWFEAGPHRLTIVRDGQVVHNGPSSAPGSGTVRALVATIADAARCLDLGHPEAALTRLRTGKALPPCAAPGPMPEHKDCARPLRHRGACSDHADLAEPPHECPALPEQLHAVVYVDHPGRSVRFGGLYADEGAAVEVANDAAYEYGRALTETTPGPGGQPLILLPADGVAGVPVVAVVGLQLLPDPREADWRDEEGRAECEEYDPDYGKDLDDEDGGE